MTDAVLSDFEPIRELSATPEYRKVEARHTVSGDHVHLLVFSEALSQKADFRRAIKTDRAMLAMLQHQSIVRFLGTGESDGCLFCWTEIPAAAPLSAQLSEGRSFQTDDVIEIGWQICSALQQAHNLGLAHGSLSVDSVCVSDNLQVSITSFCLAKWLQAGHAADPNSNAGPALITVSALASREQVEKDLSDLTTLLNGLQSAATESAGTEARSSTPGPLTRLLERFSVGRNSLPVSAREFQGRLGEILIGNDDAIPLVDERDPNSFARRSIVRDLFEPADEDTESTGAQSLSAGSATLMQFLPILLLVILVVVITLLAVVVF